MINDMYEKHFSVKIITWISGFCVGNLIGTGLIYYISKLIESFN